MGMPRVPYRPPCAPYPIPPYLWSRIGNRDPEGRDAPDRNPLGCDNFVLAAGGGFSGIPGEGVEAFPRNRISPLLRTGRGETGRVDVFVLVGKGNVLP